MRKLERESLEAIASRVGTPFYFYDGDWLRDSAARFASAALGQGSAARYAMKANSSRKILELMREQGFWIDAVSGNEVLRARRAGFPGGPEPPVILLTSDVFRDNALETVLRERVTPNVGSPGMLEELRAAGYRGPVAVRVNPGFGQGHVDATDTGGPSSKHGIWPDRLADVRRRAKESGLTITLLHAHVGTGPALLEFDMNVNRLVEFFRALLPEFADASAVSLGGGIPHPYRPGDAAYDPASLRSLLERAVRDLSAAARRPIRVEIEPGRFLVAGGAVLVTRVKDVKETRANERGPGHTFVMVDAGFCDLVRPALYGAYHGIEVLGARAGRAPEPLVVAGPLCESGDVFTRGEQELLEPRSMPRPDPGDLLALHDAGAYGASMSSNYLSIGRAAEVWWEKGKATLVARREALEDVVAVECEEPI
ncbi:MAG TPA: diaminopimelate decarboxylase [Candidatus Dormibacteraeota bacterium]|nr:diaminopimelate decarboxylase [Candidatus Dormibacteraeota bacterium]